MKRTLFRRGSLLNRFVSLWVAFAFVMSLTTVAVADTSESLPDSVPAVETVVVPVPAETPVPSEPAPEESAPPVEAPPADAPVEVPTEPANAEPTAPAVESIEAAPVTVPAEKPRVMAASIGVLSHVSGTVVPGNPSLGTYGSLGVRIDEGELGAYGVPKSFPVTIGSFTATITITVYDDPPDEVFDFSSTVPITYVVAKGGPDGANLYTYDPAVTSDTGLHTPMNDKNGKYSAISHLDFYFQVPAEIKAYKYNDLDRDGVRDEGEPFLSGWNLQLKSGSTVVKSGTTDANGKVIFSSVAPGSYTVHETVQDGWVVTSDPYPVPITVASGDKKSVEIGNAQVSDLTVVKFKDMNADGEHDEGEPVLSGWTIQLLKGGEVIASEVTDENGMVVFSGLAPGAYQVSEVQQNGWFATVLLPLDVNVVEGQDQSVHIGNAEHPDLDVLKFLDIDRDGIRDEGEPVLSGWTFQLKVEGSAVYSAVTGEDGVAHFSDVEPGSYSLDEIVSDPWFATTALPIAIVMAPNADQSVEVGNSLTVTKTFALTYPALPEGAALLVEYSIDGGESVIEQLEAAEGGVFTLDVEMFYGSTISGRWIVSLGQELITLAEFGPETLTDDLTNEFVYESVLGGVKYDDANGNGVREEGEVGLAGWTINLYRVIDGELTFISSTVTGEGGAYAFVGLVPGTYRVEEVLQDGWEQTDAPDGPAIVSGEDQVALGMDFGNTRFAPFDPEPNTEIEKSADAKTADPGDLITYTLTYRNTGDVDLEQVTITDDFDERYMTPEDVGDGVVADGKITWTRFNLLVGEERTITYSMRVDRDMPDGTTVVDNVAVIDPFGDTASWSVTVENPSLPFTEEEEQPFLPFTGTELVLLGLAVMLAVSGGLVLRRMAKMY